MIEYIHNPTLGTNEMSDIKNLLIASDDEFVPPLSTRWSTTQLDWTDKKTSIMSYYENVIEQQNIVVKDDGKIIGFLSYIETSFRFEKNKKTREVPGLYITTIIVDKDYRRQGIASNLYKQMGTIAKKKNLNLVIRVWSKNKNHISLLTKLNAEELYCIPNDRGKNIDTVYYGIMIRREELKRKGKKYMEEMYG